MLSLNPHPTGPAVNNAQIKSSPRTSSLPKPEGVQEMKRLAVNQNQGEQADPVRVDGAAFDLRSSHSKVNPHAVALPQRGIAKLWPNRLHVQARLGARQRHPKRRETKPCEPYGP